MKNLFTIILITMALQVSAQGLYVSPRYDRSFNNRPALEIGKGDITQRVALVITRANDRNMDMAYVGVRGYQTVSSFWDIIYLQLYVGGNLSVTNNAYLDLAGGLAANVALNKSLSLQLAYGGRSNDTPKIWGYLVSSASINYYFK